MTRGPAANAGTTVIGRLAALALLPLAILLGYVLLVVPYRALLAGQEAAIEDRRDRLERLGRIAAGAEGLSRALETGRSAAVATPYIDGSSGALAAANLQGLLGRLATATGMTVTSVATVTSGEAGEEGHVALALSASGPLDGLQRLLHAVESHRPLLFVEELDIINPSVSEPQFDARGQVQVLARLRIAGQRTPS